MSDTQSEQSPAPEPAKSPAPPPRAPEVPPQKPAVPPPPPRPTSEVRRVKPVRPKERRDFFSDAMKEVLSPFAGVIERKINPLLNAIEAIPDQAERFAKSEPPKLDQIHIGKYSLPVGKPETPKKKHLLDRYLRPPGAMDPGQFESVCSRCAKCVEACPADAIQLDPNHLTADGFPYVVPADQPCVVCSELACMQSCPSGALQMLDMLNIDMGTAKVDHATCLRDRGENCTLCIDVCPVANDNGLQAITASPLTGKIIVRKNICIGCGLCENRCPTEPRAITITPRGPTVDPIIA